MTGIVFAKFTKPTHRAKTIIFSNNALVTMRNGAFYLLCRVGDLQPTHLIESHISAYMVRKSVTEEGEVKNTGRNSTSIAFNFTGDPTPPLCYRVWYRP